MKFLVTGGAGFIGSHVCDAIVARGDSVVCVDNFNDYYNSERKRKNISELMDNPLFTLHEVDIRNFERLWSVFELEKPDKIIHLAATAGVRSSIINPKYYFESNVMGTINLLELSKSFGVQKFIFGSSSSVYGSREQGPFTERDLTDKPISPYAATKKSGEIICYNYAHMYGLDIVCLRFFTVYGPRGRPDMAVYKFTKLISENKTIEIYGSDESHRDYTYISDIVRGILAAGDSDLKYDIINLGNSDTVQLNQLISVIENNVGKKSIKRVIESQRGDVPITFADVSKAKDLLGWEPTIGIEKGVEKFVEWFKKEH
tara:strand:+ start:1026 stop:1973 length:948 start_codon:yes stop_codon:yes gene_type:complete